MINVVLSGLSLNTEGFFVTAMKNSQWRFCTVGILKKGSKNMRDFVKLFLHRVC